MSLLPVEPSDPHYLSTLITKRRRSDQTRRLHDVLLSLGKLNLVFYILLVHLVTDKGILITSVLSTIQT